MFLVHSIRHMNSYMRFMAIAAGIPWNDMARQWMPFQTTNTPSDATKLLHTKSFANIQPIKPTQSSISSRHKGQSTMIHRSITDPYKDQKPATGQARFYHSYTWQERRSGTTTFCLVSDYFQFRKSFFVWFQRNLRHWCAIAAAALQSSLWTNLVQPEFNVWTAMNLQGYFWDWMRVRILSSLILISGASDTCFVRRRCATHSL